MRLNNRWSLTVEPAPVAVCVGHEGDPDWKNRRGAAREWSGEDGWGYARVELGSGQAARLVVRDSVPARPNPLRYPAVRAPIELDLPEARFADCLHAQVAHLMMGLLDRRTPPGEPTNYPLAWQRDGVAVVAGLVRAGQLEVAKELARYFAENDFFGGFGSEGDAPGQGLRVMEDVAVRAGDAEFDRWLWPHVQRKADLVPKSWVGQPMQVRGLPTSVGLVDWIWKDQILQVTVRGRTPKVRAGRAFGPTVRLNVTSAIP